MKNRRRISKRFVYFVTCIMLIYAGFLFVSQQLEFSAQAQKKAELEKQMQLLNEEASELQHKIDYSYTDEYAEETAREVLGWVYDDELKFIERDKK